MYTSRTELQLTKRAAVAMKADRTEYDVGYSYLLNVYSFCFDSFQLLFRCMTSARVIPEVKILKLKILGVVSFRGQPDRVGSV